MTTQTFVELALSFQVGTIRREEFAKELFDLYFEELVFSVQAKGLRDRHEAEHLVLAILDRFLRKLTGGEFVVRSGSGITRYLKVSVQGAAKSWWRTRLSRPVQPLGDYDPAIESSSDDELVEYLLELLPLLSAEEQELIQLRFYQNKTFDEIATIKNAPLSTVHGKLRRTLVHLRSLMSES